jgi:hypothetical protein
MGTLVKLADLDKILEDLTLEDLCAMRPDLAEPIITAEMTRARLNMIALELTRIKTQCSELIQAVTDLRCKDVKIERLIDETRKLREELRQYEEDSNGNNE